MAPDVGVIERRPIRTRGHADLPPKFGYREPIGARQSAELEPGAGDPRLRASGGIASKGDLCVKEVRLGAHDVARLVEVGDRNQLSDVFRALGTAPANAAVVLIGGADGLSLKDRQRLLPFFRDRLVPALEEMEALVVDGGTDAGVMRLIGEGRNLRKARFRLVGVAAAETVAWPQSTGRGRPRLARGHPEFVLVPGSRWGDESPWMGDIAQGLSGRQAIFLIIGGGEIARAEAELALQEGRVVVAVMGSGGAADDLISNGRVTTIGLSDGVDIVASALRGAAEPIPGVSP
jgi:hypothetical protein